MGGALSRVLAERRERSHDRAAFDALDVHRIGFLTASELAAADAADAERLRLQWSGAPPCPPSLLYVLDRDVRRRSRRARLSWLDRLRLWGRSEEAEADAAGGLLAAAADSDGRISPETFPPAKHLRQREKEAAVRHPLRARPEQPTRRGSPAPSPRSDSGGGGGSKPSAEARRRTWTTCAGCRCAAATTRTAGARIHAPHTDAPLAPMSMLRDPPRDGGRVGDAVLKVHPRTRGWTRSGARDRRRPSAG